MFQLGGVYRRGGYQCPFDVKLLYTAYISLLQHTDGRSKAIQRSPRDWAQHKALAEYLLNLDLAEVERAASVEVVGAGPSKKSLCKP